jgi:acetate---CoA ligase (ADP-forming)
MRPAMIWSAAMKPRVLDPIFQPSSVAVVGASRRRDSIGWNIVHNLFRFGFSGKVFPVNPRAEVLHSVKCYPAVTAIPDPVDLAIVAVPRDAVLETVRECSEKGVRGLVVITAGFREAGEAGANLEERLRAAVRGYGMRMVGPNCMGVINADPRISLDATFSPTPARFGPIGFASQSGALGVAILNVADALGVGFTQFVSMGNKTDISSNDLLEFWEDDPDTRIIALYLESFGNPRRFTELARRLSKKKPMLVVKSGRTTAGARAASSHTGALAASDVAIDALLDQCGVIRAPTIEELFDLALALDTQPIPSGNRVAIVTNAGGPAIMATDACIQFGLALAELSEATRQRLGSFLPPEASLGNPVDMIASATSDNYGAAMKAVLEDPGVDAAIVINVTPVLYNPIDVSRSVTDAVQGSGKPVLSVFMANEEFYEEVRRVENHPPIYRFPESAARVLADMARIGAWQRRPEGTYRRFQFDAAAIGSLLEGAAGRNLDPNEVRRLLEAVGIPVARQETASDLEGLAAAAGRVGYPVALKAAGQKIVHKSDVGAVAIGLRNEADLRKAFTAMTARLAAAGVPAEEYLVQQMISDGREIVVGAVQDRSFGPLVMFGLGGKYVEVFGDVRFRVAPVSTEEARETVGAIRGARLLEGVRGERPSDRDFLAEMILRIAQLAEQFPRIEEIEINPLLALEHGGVAVDARVTVSR